MHNRTIISTVTDRATASADASLMADARHENGVEGFKRWEQHWLDVGKKWSDELKAEGLIKTAETLDKHLDWFERNKTK